MRLLHRKGSPGHKNAGRHEGEASGGITVATVRVRFCVRPRGRWGLAELRLLGQRLVQCKAVPVLLQPA